MFGINRPVAKPIVWQCASLADLRAFPETARASAGRELRKMQFGLKPSDWKFVSGWGSGLIEIRLDDHHNAYRVVCVAKFREAVYVLHCFHKTSQKTAAPDKDIIRSRYQQLIQTRKE